MKPRVVTIWFVAFALATLACIVSLFAQATNGVPVPGGNPASAGAFKSAQLWIDLFTPIVAPLLTALVKKIKPGIPSLYLPVIAVILGVLAGGIATVTIGTGVESWLTVAKTVGLSLAGIGVRQLQHEVSETVKAANAPSI